MKRLSTIILLVMLISTSAWGMKEHIIGYAIDQQGQWWTGINLTNHSYNNTSVLLDYYGPNGAKIKSEEIKMTALSQKAFIVDIPYRGWIRAISDNNLTINEYVGDYESTSIVPIEKRDVIVRDVCNLNPGVVKIGETEFVHDCSQTNHYLTNGYWDIVQLIARWIHYKYPDRKAQKLEINDASTQSGSAEGHPTGSHQRGLACDFCYYTLGDTNHTQRSISCSEPLIPIDGDLFDAERNVELIIKLNEIFPNAQILSYVEYEKPLRTAAWRLYGDEMREKFSTNSFIQYDTNTGYNHHKHLHVGVLGGTGEYEKVNSEFDFGIR